MRFPRPIIRVRNSPKLTVRSSPILCSKAHSLEHFHILEAQSCGVGYEMTVVPFDHQ